MARLPSLRFDELDDQGRALWERLVASRANKLINEQGGLVGPYNAWVSAPGVGRRVAELGSEVRFETSIERRLSELAIITTGAHWKAEFEWWARSRMAIEHGLSESLVSAIGTGRPPTFERDDERVVHAVASQLADGAAIDKPTYDECQGLLGHLGMVELVTLCGFYTLVSFTLNAFEVPLPPGAPPMWTPHA